MVFTGCIPDITKKILPHFGREDSPVARFEPTERGWAYAITFANAHTLTEINWPRYENV
jgi:hypothetical protein